MLHIQRSPFSAERAWYARWLQDAAGTTPNISSGAMVQEGGAPSACSFYAAEVLLALEYLHKNNVIYRHGACPVAATDAAHALC